MIGDTIALTKYLEFIDATPPARKTSILLVRSVMHGNILGEIRWYGSWRQYAFWPRSGTIWNVECLRDVNERIEALMAARRG
jgi:hypothetical protein